MARSVDHAQWAGGWYGVGAWWLFGAVVSRRHAAHGRQSIARSAPPTRPLEAAPRVHATQRSCAVVRHRAERGRSKLFKRGVRVRGAVSLGGRQGCSCNGGCQLGRRPEPHGHMSPSRRPSPTAVVFFGDVRPLRGGQTPPPSSRGADG